MSGNKPELILIHGSWLGGWSWDAVGNSLTRAGCRIETPTLSGLSDRSHLLSRQTGLSSHIDDICASCLSTARHGITLVGHSYGALVAAGAASRFGTIVQRLIILDGFLPEANKSAFDLHPGLRGMMESLALPEKPWLAAPPPPEMINIKDAGLASDVVRKMTPMPIMTHEQALVLDEKKMNQLERHYIRCTRFPVFEENTDMASGRGWHTIALDAGHMAMLTDPEMVTEAILSCVQISP